MYKKNLYFEIKFHDIILNFEYNVYLQCGEKRKKKKIDKETLLSKTYFYFRYNYYYYSNEQHKKII